MLTRRADTRFDPSRRQALRTLVAVLPAVAAAACAPARIVLRAYPAEFKGDSARTQATPGGLRLHGRTRGEPPIRPAPRARCRTPPTRSQDTLATWPATSISAQAGVYHCPFTDLACVGARRGGGVWARGRAE